MFNSLRDRNLTRKSLDFSEINNSNNLSEKLTEAIHKLHQAKTLKNVYYKNLKSLEARCKLLEQENKSLKEIIEKNKEVQKGDSDSSMEAYGYALNSFSNEVKAISKSFIQQEKLIKKCIQDLDFDLEVSNRIQETVDEYLATSRTSELQLKKIFSSTANDKMNTSEYSKDDNSLVKAQRIPSLFEEIGYIEEINPKTHNDAVLISRANLERINKLKVAIKKIAFELKSQNNLAITKRHTCNSMYLIKKAITGSITYF